MGVRFRIFEMIEDFGFRISDFGFWIWDLGFGKWSRKKCGIDFEGMKVRFRIRKIIEKMGWVLDFGFLK